MQPLRFVLQAIDPEYGHPAFETMFVVERPDELRGLLRLEQGTDPDLEMHYRLRPDEVAAVTRHFGLGFDPQGREAGLFKWNDRSRPPYLVHTGYELVLMIEGRKPFTRMSWEYPPNSFPGEERFDRHVASGLLNKEVQIESFAEPIQSNGRIIEGYRTVYYTLKGEEWRIAAWRIVAEAARKSGWNDSFERLEGMLLGYEEWQNDWWAAERRRNQQQFGKLLLNMAVTANEIAAIENAGHRALPLGQRTLRLVSAMTAEVHDDERRWLMMGEGLVAVVRFRVKARAFLTHVASDTQAARHEVPPDRIKDLNRLIEGEIEVLAL